LGFGQYLSSLVAGIAGEAGELLQLLLGQRLEDVHHGEQVYLLL
jgi:hypothetical protein